jgi:hypothetical protein
MRIYPRKTERRFRPAVMMPCCKPCYEDDVQVWSTSRKALIRAGTPRSKRSIYRVPKMATRCWKQGKSGMASETSCKNHQNVCAKRVRHHYIDWPKSWYAGSWLSVYVQVCNTGSYSLEEQVVGPRARSYLGWMKVLYLRRKSLYATRRVPAP